MPRLTQPFQPSIGQAFHAIALHSAAGCALDAAEQLAEPKIGERAYRAQVDALHRELAARLKKALAGLAA
ncbi:hypothetical protein ACFSVK_18265 [Azorhizophilus paspali]